MITYHVSSNDIILYHIHDATILYPYLSCNHLVLLSHEHISSIHPILLSCYLILSHPSTTITKHIPQTKSQSISPTIYKTLSYTLPTIL